MFESGANNMYGIVRVQKYHNETIRGIENHLERRATTTNPNIQKEKSKNNYDLTGQQDRTLKSLIKELLQKFNIAKPRKNAVTMVELMFTASPEFFEGKSSEEIKAYFTDCYNWACKKYGKKNVIASDVHLDEKTPHMHLELVPIVKGKLNARELFNHKLDEFQEQAHNEIFSKYGLERGDSHSKAKHISTLNYKILTLQHELDQKQLELVEVESKLNNNELYKMHQQIKSLQDKLSKMFQVLERNPNLMAEYKKAIEEMQRREKREKDNSIDR